MTLTCKISVVGRLVTETIYASYIDLWLKSLLAEGIRSCCCHGSESITSTIIWLTPTRDNQDRYEHRRTLDMHVREQ